jgi:hypothetical protein
MDITLENGGEQVFVRNLPYGTEAGHIRTLQSELEDIGAPSSFTLAVDGRGVEDNTPLTGGCTVTFRPKDGGKGAR